MWTSRILSSTFRAAPLTQAAMKPQRAMTPATTFIRQSSSSTSAISYKRSHPHKRHPALTADYLHPAPPSAEEAVSNILYNTPPIGHKQTRQRHILNCLVQNEPGVLSRVSGILAGRGFNIDSLVVAKTEVADLSRMTIVLKGESTTVEQARRQLEDLVPVWAVLDYTGFKVIERELLLIKVSILGPEHVRAQMNSRAPNNYQLVQEETEEEMTPSNALRQTHAHLKSLTELAKLFQGKVVDVSSDCVVIELSAKPDRVDAFVKLVKPFGILEAARSGSMAMPRSPIYDRNDYEEEEEAEDQGSGVDASLLPPG
ncbi:small subunit of acetolactate synthase-domain-containing protein [Gamsiella multidivaricata]|uniref:small subunit of acetolactate synthase-domain-containing protein n=1 Tax=Gamsiella multidivaricata TaxID=101098 RepID=UPI0022205FEC|nr:small subunit of acetolactate synthase-domain-containing protein [Gamsiella multidivaricata]KAI7830692.1 small subunit of acetolactate synthase-domain-containing protein [Gamsiella multidivaricata]